MLINVGILYNIIDDGFLFPHNDGSSLIRNSFELKLYQAILPHLTGREGEMYLDKKTIESKYPDLYKKLVDFKFMS
jgi:hypothetical protein